MLSCVVTINHDISQRAKGKEKDNHGTHPRLNSCSDERSRSGSIHLVVPVLIGNDDAVLADVISGVADDQDLGRSDRSERLVTVGVTKSHNYTSSAWVRIPLEDERTYQQTLAQRWQPRASV
jgi:hypothetical protein